MRQSWPLWYCISARSKMALWVYQWETYQERLELVPEVPPTAYPEVRIEPRGEIARLMRMAPTRSSGVY